MKILRSVTHRGFSVVTAGWFTVLKPNTWFPASRLPVRERHISDQAAAQAVASAPIPERQAPDRAGVEVTTASPRIVELSAHDRQPARLALAVVAAIAITSILLWWIILAR